MLRFQYPQAEKVHGNTGKPILQYKVIAELLLDGLTEEQICAMYGYPTDPMKDRIIKWRVLKTFAVERELFADYLREGRYSDDYNRRRNRITRDVGIQPPAITGCIIRALLAGGWGPDKHVSLTRERAR